MIFTATLQQMAFLFTLILIGFLMAKINCVPDNATVVLSKLENYLFIPALVLGTFVSNFTIDKIENAGTTLLVSLCIEIVVILISLLCVKLLTKDKYTQNIYLYGLCFSNFGFMGNAIVKTLFPDVFWEYLIFTMPLWILIYLWGIPNLLISNPTNNSLKSRFKNLLNPMVACMILGIIIGLCGLKLPSTITTLIDSVGDCMSPIAMIITGMTIAKMNVKSVLKIKSIYVVSVLRLIVFPLLFIGFCFLMKWDLNQNFVICAVASLAMPLGLNTIVIPSAYGKDTTVASGMALVSHILSIITIPLIFLFFNL